MKDADWQLPEAVTIGAQQYEVRILDEISEEPGNAWGFCDGKKKVLTFAPEFPNASLFLITYFHECIHAISGEYGVEFKDGENDIDRIAQGIVQGVLALVDAA